MLSNQYILNFTFFRATGEQGSAVIDYVLNETELSLKYKPRAATHDPNSEGSYSN